MLETRNLKKVYTPKKGVPVLALAGVSLKFPERGMVFLLGKSGSGKSTLLNLLGGLDKYDEGEIIIKGVSSRDFSQERFDSYRNTYVGFIFQDYNILEEFTVGANIALALELQGKKATDEELNRILEEVDLVGYGNRKPNELSGGQLQRVAIARALVKNPEIIMADEPTGALDSATGKQVFDTLKKLSAEKLVIIVSHDREYAEFYADRIIELADGRVISDVEHTPEADGEKDSLAFDGNTITVPMGYHLTEEDRAEINAYIDRIKSGTRLHFSGLTKKFHDTDVSKIPAQDPSKFALIKSRLPLRSAFRIGSSGLKHKKFRLFMTILLSVVAFTLFALADTFGAYDHINACTTSIEDSNISYLSLAKSKKITYSDGDYYWRSYGYKLDDNDLEEIRQGTGRTVIGVYIPTGVYGISFANYVSDDITLYSSGSRNIYSKSFAGFAEVTERALSEIGYNLTAGRLPDGGKNEIALTQYDAETFIHGGFYTGETKQDKDGFDVPVYDKISKSSDLLGRKLRLNGTEYEIVGIIDTGFDLSRYERLTEDDSRDTNADSLVKYVLMEELNYAQNYSFHNLVLVGEGAVAGMIESERPELLLDGVYIRLSSWDYTSDVTASEYIDVDPSYIGKLSDIKDDIVWAGGTPRDKLGDGEIIVTRDALMRFKLIENDMYGSSYEGQNVTSDDYALIFNSEYFGRMWKSGHDDELSSFRVVGIIEGNTDEVPDSEEDGYDYDDWGFRAIYVADSFYEDAADGISGSYTYAVGAMPTSRGDIEKIVRYSYREDTDIRYSLQNPVTYELDMVNEVLIVLARVFLWIGVGFAIFASIMLANFIGTSIAYKKQEIGILRAIGSRSSDVFFIFFSEAFIIAAINFVIASAATFAISAFINYYIRQELGILVTVLYFGLRQIGLVLLISVGVAALSCFLPVKKIASKRPIDAIRGR